MIVIKIVVFFGILIFIHELGHFLVAKSVGVRVNTFSLGFGPRLFGVKIGDTDYRVSIIPLGGYVHMAGQFDVPDKEAMEELTGEPWEFPSKPWWQRFLIAAAGSTMNIILAFAIFAMVAFAWGFPKYESTLKIGLIDDDAPEYNALQMKDVILEANNSTLKTWEELESLIKKSPNKPIDFLVKRDEKDITVTITPEGQPIGKEGSLRGRFGIVPYLEPIVGEVHDDQPAATARLRLYKGDKIIAIDGNPIEQWSELKDVVSKKPNTPIEFTIRRTDAFQIRMLTDDFDNLKNSGLQVDETNIVIEVLDKSEAYKSGFLADDIILNIDKHKIPFWKRWLYRIKGHRYSYMLIFEVKREKPFQTVLTTSKNPFNNEGFIGITNDTQGILREIGREKLGFMDSIDYGFRSTVFYSQIIFISIKKLVEREVSVDNLAGPLGITQMISQQAKAGLKELLEFLAILSVNLGIINFFPIPILDGGLMVVLLVEGIRRKPLSIKLQVALQQIGFLILIPLIIYVTYNDVVRMLGKLLSP